MSSLSLSQYILDLISTKETDKQPDSKKALDILIMPHSDVTKTQSVKDFIKLVINSSLSKDFEVKITLTNDVSKDMVTDVYFFIYRGGERSDIESLREGLYNSPDCKLKEIIFFKPTPILANFQKKEGMVNETHYRTLAFDSQAGLHMCQANDETIELMVEKIKEVMNK